MPRPRNPQTKPPKVVNPEPGITWRPDRAKWQVKVSAFGKRVSKFFTNLADARAWKLQAQTTPPEPQTVGLTVRQWVDTYLADLEHTAKIDPTNGLAPSTIAGYRDKLERYALPHLGDLLLADLDALTIKQWIKKIQGAQTVNGAWEGHRRLKGCLAVAVRLKIIPDNPCLGISPPKGERSTKNKSASPSRWTNEEARQVLETLETPAHLKSPIRQMIKVWLGTGLREEELWALHTSSIDLTACQLEVLHTCTYVRKQGMVMRQKTKTGKIRTVPFDQFVQQAIFDQLERNQFFRRLHPNEYIDLGLLFANEHGGIFSQTLFRKWYNRLCNDANVRRIRPYDLRSTHGTALHFQHVDEQVAAKRLGHSVHVYRETYVRPLETEQREGVIPTDLLYSVSPKRPQNLERPQNSQGEK